jgi:Immunity protein 10
VSSVVWASVREYTLNASQTPGVETTPVSVTTMEEDGVFIVGFSAADNPGLTLVFQLSDRVDGQDALLEMDTYSISNAAAATVYGGVVSAGFEGTILKLRLTRDAAQVVGTSVELSVRLADASAVEVARSGLRRVGISAADL